ncbi:MAG: GNAT family N-acetyltransferase [Lachnospiraceae bacterium]
MNELSFVNTISCEDYNRLRAEVNWKTLPQEQALAGIVHSAYLVACRDGENAVATARVLWDGGYVAYICDVIVSPTYQKMGIGRELVNRILNYLKSQLKEGWFIMVTLVSAHGKEPFYEKIGFIKRPNEQYGAGMTQWIELKN